MKNFKIITILVAASLLLSCGFKRVDQKKNSQIYFQNITIEGEQKIAYLLRNDILYISNKNAKNKYDLKIEITKKKNSKIKDKTGKVVRYSLFVSALIELENIYDKTMIKKTFSRNEDYDVANIHSDTIKNEKNSTKNISQLLSVDIINFITFTMRNK